MLYGEVYANNIDPECGEEPSMKPCLPGRWITPAAMSIYLLVANILLINLLIAVFNNIFIEVNAVAHQVWMFQRFTVVMEYEQKPVLPPPFIAVSHLYLLGKYLLRYITQGEMRSGETYDNGLKLFLEADDMERLYDFEEDCVEGYFREQELKLQMSTEERVKITTERVENMHQKIEDIDKKEHNQNASLQAVEFRIRKLEDLNEQTLACLGVIHRFMATHMSDENLANLDSEMRPRRVSERSELVSDTESHTHIPTVLRQKRLIRSLTDATVLQSPFVDDETLKHSETLTSRENLSRNGSSSSGDIPTTGPDEKKTLTTSQEESAESKDINEPELKPLRREVERDTSSDIAISDMRQDSSERPTRQSSRTRSESDDAVLLAPPGLQRGIKWGEPRVAMIPPGSSGASNQRSLLRAMRAEYTSITDELESYCGLLSPPRTPPVSPPPSRSKNSVAMNPEMAWQMENEHLRDAEECDYQQMEDLIHRRYMRSSDEDSDNELTTKFKFSVTSEHRMLRRSSAIDEESRRPPPTISVTREIEQTLSRPPAIREADDKDPTDEGTVPAPASEIMC